MMAAGERIKGCLLENGCGIGLYLEKLTEHSHMAIGLEYEFPRAREAHQLAEQVVNAAGEAIPFPNLTFNFILSHEVLEHVQDDRLSLEEMVRALKPGGRLAIFVPNRGYPFETHGIYWRGHYHFGNIPLVNYLPSRLRDHLAPHVRVYSTGDLRDLFAGLPVRFVQQRVIFGAYDNIIARWPRLGSMMRGILQDLENSPARVFGLSHFWVVEKV
jgi:SAM-dependent methyltransferase